MSLIADALKAAQSQKGNAEGSTASSRRAAAESVLRPGASRSEAYAGMPVGMSPPLKWAVFGLGGALILAAGLIYLAPDQNSPSTASMEEPVPSTTDPAIDGTMNPEELPFLGALDPGRPEAAAMDDGSFSGADGTGAGGGGAGQVAPDGASAGARSVGFPTGRTEASAGDAVGGGSAGSGTGPGAGGTDRAGGAIGPATPAGVTTAISSTAAPPAAGPAFAGGAPPPGAARTSVSSAPVSPAATQTDVPGPSAPRSGGRFELSVAPAKISIDERMAEALAVQRVGDLPGAIVLYEQILDQSPTHVEALNNLGIALHAVGDLARARESFRAAIAADQGNASAWSNLGAVLGRLGENEQARAALGEAIRLDPTNLGARVNLANLHLAEGLIADARMLLDEVLRRDPWHPEGNYAMGKALDLQGDWPGAVRHYQAFLQYGATRFPALETPVRLRIRQLTVE